MAQTQKNTTHIFKSSCQWPVLSVLHSGWLNWYAINHYDIIRNNQIKLWKEDVGMEQHTLFENDVPQPLAARLRPQKLEEFVGQTHLLGKGKGAASSHWTGSDFLYDFLGTARGWQDNAGENHCQSYESRIYRFFCSDKQYQGHPCSYAEGWAEPSVWR